MSLSNRCSKIKAIILDVDGVLTNGLIGYHDNGNEIKFFHVRDGHGLKLAQRAGLKIGILSGRKSVANRTRFEELKLDFMYEGIKDKDEGFTRLLEEQHLAADECMYFGDDLVDARPMARCGLAVAVGDAVAELDKVAHIRTKANGGQGAIREGIEFLLKEQGQWEKLMVRYFS